MKPNNLDYIRAHQYLYYVAHQQVLTDHEYDMFGRHTGEDYKGGSDNPLDYSVDQVVLAHGITLGGVPPFPVDYGQ